MANNYEQATVDPTFPSSVLTPIIRQFLELSGFTVSNDGKEAYIYCEESSNEEALTDCDAEDFDDMTAQNEFDQRILDCINDSEGESQDLPTYCDAFQYMAKAAGIEEVVIEGAYTCDKMRMGEFGGFVTRITPDSIQYGGNISILTRMREGTW